MQKRPICSILTALSLAVVVWCGGCGGGSRRWFSRSGSNQQDGSDTTASRPVRAHHPINRTTRPTTRPVASIESAILMVNNESITAGEVLRRCRPDLERLAKVNPEPVFRNKAHMTVYQSVVDIVREVLLYRQIAGRISKEQEPAVQKAIDQAVNNVALHETNGSTVRLEQILAEQGATMHDLRKELRRQILNNQYLNERFRPKVIVTRSDLWQYYQSHPSEFDFPARVRLTVFQIDTDTFLPSDVTWSSATAQQRDLADAMAKKQLAAARERLKGGADFSDVVRELSTGASAKLGGDIGWITKGSYRVKAVEEQAFELPIGKVSEPITVDRTVYLIKVTAFEPARHTSFAQAQSQIKPKLEQQFYAELVRQHLAELLAKAQIGSVEPFVREVVARMPPYEELKRD